MGFLARTAITALALWAAAAIVPGIAMDGTGTLFLAALLLGLVNATVRPVAFVLSLPLTVLTLGLFRAPDPTAAGIVETAADGRVLSFEEKPRHPTSDLANAGVYLARRALLDRLPVSNGILDFGHDVFPRLLGEIYAWPVQGFLMDIGTPAALVRAADAWAGRRQTVVP